MSVNLLGEINSTVAVLPVLRKSSSYHPCVAHLRDASKPSSGSCHFPDGRAVSLSCGRGLKLPLSCGLGLGWSWCGCCRRMLLLMRRPGAGPRRPVGNGTVTPRQEMFDGLCLLLDCRELLGKVLNSVGEEATLRDGGTEKANLVTVPHLSKVELEIVFLHYQGGHRLAESLHHDLLCS